MPLIIAALALAIALASFLINSYQVVTRNRPWVFVSSLREASLDQHTDRVEIEVTNLGQLPAKGVELSTTWGTFREIASGQREAQPSATVGVIFPNQKSRSVTHVDTLHSARDKTVEVKLTYRSSLIARLLRHHATTQYLFLTIDGDWGTIGAGEADYS